MSQAADFDVSATKDLSCIADRASQTFNCTAGEFTVSPTFSAADGEPPFCMAGQDFEFVVEIELSGSNTDRYDVGFFVGQEGNNPAVSTASTLNSGNALCSVATFPALDNPTPTVSNPWFAAANDEAGDLCGDYMGGGDTTNRIDKIKVVCTADSATSALQIPYMLSYKQNEKNNGLCTGPTDVSQDNKSKCVTGTSVVNGVVAVQVGVWMDITKQTTPDQQSITTDGFTPQSFTYTATAPSGSKVIALVGATLSSTGVSGGTYIPATISEATNSTTFTLSDGETARVFMTASDSDQTLTVTEATTTGWVETAEDITCSGGVSYSTDTANRSMAMVLNTTTSAGECTITNTKKPQIQIEKISTGDIGSFEFTGTAGWSTATISTTAVDTAEQGSVQYLTPYTAASVSETSQTDFRLDDMSCVDNGYPVAAGTISYDYDTATVSMDANAMSPGAEILCTYTNIRQRPLTVTKVLDDPFKPGLFLMSANGEWSEEGGDGTTVSTIVDVGATVSAAEAAGTDTDLNDYNASYVCDTDPATAVAASGDGNSASFTMPNGDIICTFTNSRKTANLVLSKQWQVGFENDEVSLASSGFINNASLASSVSNASGDNLDSGSAATVYVGESGTLAESWLSGEPNYYNSVISCSGTDGLTDSTLLVGQDDTDIECTFTNSRKSASLTLQKQWVNADAGSVIELTSSGFGNDADATHDSTSVAENLTSGDPATVYILESGSLAETWLSGSGTLDLSDFATTVTCSGTDGFDSASNSLTIGIDDTDIVCTFTNEQLKPKLSVIKQAIAVEDPVNGTNNPKAIPGALVEYSIKVENSGLGQVDADSITITDAIPANLVMYVDGIEGTSAAVIFEDDSISSGLSWSSGQLQYSADGGSSWGYTPSADAKGLDANVTNIRINPTGVMNERNSSGNPGFEIRFWVMVE
ncbi:prealbumin-like fold domain-containing protein [Oceanobacter mangrovi]|uniref:prealbumin-like fold domain-containing protein n=1 Tax=Oceanobacter mangrovi TaxID=2862510 RepID=UPI001C8EA235|nr:hypothetical protein [Oceanobacter mangrovi]